MILLLTFISGSGFSKDDAIRKFKAWFKKYKKGEILLYQPSSVPLHHQDKSKLRYYKKENLQEMDSLLEGLAKTNNLKATQLLVEAASYTCHRNPDVEIEKHFEKQPWLLRSHAKESLKQIDDPESIKWLRDRCLNKRSGSDASVRKVIALSVFGRDSALKDPTLLVNLLQDRDAEVRIEALEGLARVGASDELVLALDMVNDKIPLVRVAAIEAAGEILTRERKDSSEQAAYFVPVLSRHLEDPEWPVQETILSMMERFRARESIPILIEFLTKVDSNPDHFRERIIQRVTEVLRSLTGAYIQSTNPAEWNQWWIENKESFRLSEVPSPTLRGFQLDGPAFFNIPVNSDCVYFILDISGSMRAPLPSQRDTNPDAPKPKLDRARMELSRTMSALDQDVYFNVILFNETIRVFKDKPIKASEKAKEEASLFFQEAHADEGTNIVDSLNMALEIKSMGLVNRIGDDVILDTIFLLSDGVPTTGIVIDPVEILHIVTRANRLTKIKINAIYLGAEPNQFMRLLAENNYGNYVQIR
jgi:hypothetical protein